ncbi:hypothetical protein SPRG_20715 [Saprolegnia parasitica CBS 223.65]|uniref:Uncharacterized protein n=1 Tax=Saprolegnia parasitica (strain CBS 223.65) TaxID=695850 RepID=A0A067C9D5_SAPPC|nr:hypothetical protein SPRG_20715 [Saprolegnia parasitica CBS 223.65]KDO25760.1 hypothetical protein SPRG_20715 [Saprolegnia parasitica CBS 223.65]|eukprot:XP_012203601.1 hypothetical protein SPRG_20715 [Saprolegnia parasitica CBS 223.65]
MVTSTSDSEKQARKRAARKTRYEANKEEVRAYQKQYYAANAEKLAAQRKARYEKNRDQEMMRSKTYRQTHKEVVKAKNKSWNVANRAFRAAYAQARRARKKALAAGEEPAPLPTLADLRAAQEASDQVVASTAADDQLDDVPHPLAATTKPIEMVSFTNEHPFNLRKRGPEPVCNECARFHPNALTSATNTVLLPGTYQCTLCRDWTYYRRHRKHERTRADARLDAPTA